MFDVKPKVEKKGSSTETDEGLGSSGKRCGSGSLGSGSLGSGSLGSGSVYLSDSQDWAVSPGCSPDEAPGHHSAISPALAQETFRYMTYLALDPTSYPLPDSRNLSKVLSSERMEQMTKTYNDIEVVTHLLAERDRDLELAARIGQSLLQRNHLLQERNEAIEEQLTQAIDQVHQLQHDLSKKDELLRMVASVSEESETDSSCSTPLCHLRPPGGGVAGATAALSQLEALQGKLQELEEENLSLRSEACHLKTETITYEEKEQRLVSDCVKELRESNSHMVSLTDELSQKNEALVRHQEEIAQLLSQIVELQHRVKELALEKEELRIHLQASKDAQRQLTAELNELAERHAECVEMLHESQEEIKDLHNKSTPSAGMRRHLSHGLYPMDSLAAEIEGTMRRELSVEEETTFQEQRTSQKRVFQTVRSVNSSVARASSATPPIPGSGLSSLVMTAQPYRSTKGEEARVGQPGSPGGNDLNDAIHRLSLRRHNFLCERQFFRAERERKLRGLAGPAEDPDAFDSPMGSALSSFSNLSELSVSSGIFKTFLPEKLQIVKPMEGSLTLHHWQQLAKPHLGTVLDPHPGVVTKGFRPLPQDTVYHLEDLEEDEDSGAGNGCEGRRDEGILEKGSAEEGRVKGRGYEEEEDGGIVFKVRCSSTPEEKKERTPPGPELCRPPEVAPPSSSIPAAKSGPTPTTTTPHPVKDTISLLAKPLPVASSTPVQSEVRISTLTATTSSWSSVQNPGKCQSSTFSTYTFTTCRILHPSDVTQVTTSFQSSVMANTPSSMRTGPSTPVTPCRLSLGDSFPPRRPMVPPSGLTKLVLEKGISATQVSPDGPTVVPHPTTTKQPLLCLLPGTPPNSPSHSPTPSPVPFLSRPPAPADNFLASRPAELFLQDMYGLTVGRAVHPDLPSPSEPKPAAPTANPFSEGLVERLRRLGFAKVLQGPRRQDSSTFVGAGSGSLLDGLRRNQSLPAMIGAQPRPPLLPHLHPCHPPPPHPTSLALSPPPWGDPKEQRHRGRLASLSQPSSSSGKH